jgi:ATP-binding cassette subfamily C protein CydD
MPRASCPRSSPERWYRRWPSHLVWVDWMSALIVVLTLPLLPFFAALIGKTTQADTEKRWAALSALSGHFLDVVRGLPTLVTYGRAQRQVEVIGEVSQRTGAPRWPP